MERELKKEKGRRKKGTTKSWNVSPQDTEKSKQLSEKLAIPRAAAQVLINRGIDDEKEGWYFLHPDLSQLHSPFLLKGMQEAVDLIVKRLQGGERITVFGDYDVDGVTATALLFWLFKKLDAAVDWHIPSRLEDGYGLNSAALEKICKRGTGLLITVDCGIGACEEAALARQMGMEVVITDHHQPGQALPQAPIVNPLQPGCRYPFKELSGVGLAYKLAAALLERMDHKEKKAWTWELLDLVALGTVADVVPLLGENRVLTAKGLEKMNLDARPGLRELCEKAGMKERELTARDLAFGLAPRLNAAGRLGDAACAVELLLTDDQSRASELAQFLNQENSRRQQLESRVLEEAIQMAERKLQSKGRPNTLVLAREGWHQGVLGIVASRMVEMFGCPVILIGLEGEIGKGSGRSTGGFNLVGALEQCASCLVEFGGHSAAAGLTIEKEKVCTFGEEIERLAGGFFGPEGPVTLLHLDAFVRPEEVNIELARSLERLAPFGFGNPRPLFFGDNWLIQEKREVGREGKHLRLVLEKDSHLFQGIGFDAHKKLPELSSNRRLSPAFHISLDRWRGKEKVQLEICHFKYSDEAGGEAFTLVDRRGVSHKESYITATAGEKKNILVYVNTTATAQRLRRRFKEDSRIAVSHQGRCEPPAEEEVAVADIILYEVPWQEEQLLNLLAQITTNSKGQEGEDGFTLHLIFGEQDYYNNVRMLLAMLPTLCSVTQIYYSFQQLSERMPLSLEQAVGALKKNLPFQVTGPLIDKGLAILKETSLVEVKGEELHLNGYIAGDFSNLLQRIAGSDLFQLERERWDRVLAWQQLLVFSEGEEIASSLLDNI